MNERGAFNRAGRRAGGPRRFVVPLAGAALGRCIACNREIPELPVRRSCAGNVGEWCRAARLSDYSDEDKTTLARVLGEIVMRPQHPNSVAWAAHSHLSHLGFVTMSGTGSECRLVATDAGRAWLEFWVSAQLKTAVQP